MACNAGYAASERFKIKTNSNIRTQATAIHTIRSVGAFK